MGEVTVVISISTIIKAVGTVFAAVAGFAGLMGILTSFTREDFKLAVFTATGSVIVILGLWV